MIIYKTTNLINGKIYIGYDTKNRPNYYGSGKIYRQAEKKYGKENFRKTIIDSDEDFASLCRKEIFWIDFYDARNPIIGYNLLPGGDGFPPGKKHYNYGKHLSEELRQKISKINIGRKLTEEQKQKQSIMQKGKKHSEERNLRQSLRMKSIGIWKGKSNPMFDVHRFGEKHPMFGVSPSLESNKKNSNTHKEMYKNKEDCPMFGKHHSKDSKKKTSDTIKRWWAERKNAHS